MNDAMLKKVAEDLVALSNEFGEDEHGARRIKIPRNRDEAMGFLKKFGYSLYSTFPFDDPIVVDEVRRLAEKHRSVFVVVNTDTLKLELYTPPDENVQVQESKGGGCFIATAVYGSYSSPEVMILRQFRDQVLLKSVIGRGFVRAYYLVSPFIANFIYTREPLRKWLSLALIDRFVRYAKKVVK